MLPDFLKRHARRLFGLYRYCICCDHATPPLVRILVGAVEAANDDRVTPFSRVPSLHGQMQCFFFFFLEHAQPMQRETAPSEKRDVVRPPPSRWLHWHSQAYRPRSNVVYDSKRALLVGCVCAFFTKLLTAVCRRRGVACSREGLRRMRHDCAGLHGHSCARIK